MLRPLTNVYHKGACQPVVTAYSTSVTEYEKALPLHTMSVISPVVSTIFFFRRVFTLVVLLEGSLTFRIIGRIGQHFRYLLCFRINTDPLNIMVQYEQRLTMQYTPNG